MGYENRDYAQYEGQGVQLSMPQSVTMRLVMVNVAVYLLQMFTQYQIPGGPTSPPMVTSTIDQYFALSANWFQQPWKAYQLLSYGFLHSLADIGHILVNMVVLWMFGRELENRYGSKQFLGLYLTAIVFAGLGWSIIEAAYGGPAGGMLGASGGIAALFLLYALNWPYRKVLFMLVIPMPMWLAAGIALFYDAMGAVNRSGNVAFTAHLSGTLFGFLFYKTGFNPLGNFLSGLSTTQLPRRGPKLRVHSPEEEEERENEIDRILRKVSASGQGSLTRGERRTLEKESQRIKDRR
ncbi:rhomboid family intramembrane serine protease [Adhaeretor mobilis]|uniref:Rhomboid family protein n=1 Tax=Adhaeretor mobilis TaxID=1930276 RepID=A0A517N2M7_9BACT|nr:rhomboid family intramembrane serine protease [Adhaeretor mobilis]QDT01385.1 Rhomboid family protein [Adhaeretor mobilis]